MKELLRKPYVFWVIGIFLGYMTLNVLVSQFYQTALYIPYYLDTLKWGKLLVSGVFSITIGILIAINSVYAYIRYKERKAVMKEGVMTSAATIGGLATGICSACVAGLFPLMFGAFGVSFSFAALPFEGMEVQALIIGVLGFSLYLLRKN